MPTPIYFNPMQREVALTGANTNIIVAGRGTGKGLLHAWSMLRNFQYMPRCTIGVVAPFAKRALTNTLPSMFEHWERWGYRRGVHWEVGRRPNKNLDWPLPLIPPERWEDYITFYNGSCAHIISQDRSGTSNSKSYDGIDIDEAKFVNFEKLKDETLPANRGQVQHFGDVPFHHGLLLTSDMPVSKQGSWFLRYEKDCDEELIKMIQSLVSERWKVSERIRKEGPSEYLTRQQSDITRYLTKFRRSSLLFRRYSSLTNIAVLGEAWVRQMKRDLPPLIFASSILCLRQDFVRDGFYSSLRPRHLYTSSDFSYIENLFISSGGRKQLNDCRMDSDLQKNKPLCVAFDYNAKINWLIVGQPDEHLKRMNTLKSFYVKYERKLPELVDDFCEYYRYYPTKTVIYYYDSTALGSNYAVNDQDFLWVIKHQFRLRGWNCHQVGIGKPLPHGEKYLLINRGFAGQCRLTPFFNAENNEALLMAIKTAGVYNGHKDKRGEKLAETDEDLLEYRTDGTDAWDTLYIGCERFPQKFLPVPTSSTVNY